MRTLAVGIALVFLCTAQAASTASSELRNVRRGSHQLSADISVDVTSLSNATAANGTLQFNAVYPPGPARNTIVVENCGRNEQDINDMLFKVIGALKFARQDALENGKASYHGFNALFKNNKRTRDVVIHLLQMMTNMEGLPGLWPEPNVKSHPRFACVDVNTVKDYDYLELGYDPWVKCHSRAVQSTSLRSFYADGTSYIFLCPAFLDLAVESKYSYCPWIRENQFIGFQTLFNQRYQLYRVIYQLSRFYLGKHALDGTSNPREMFNWNDCVFDLNPFQSILNPTNLELYVASKSSPHAYRIGLASNMCANYA